jgi:5'-nucleotidase
LAEEARSGAAELRAAGADLVVAIVHAGGRCDQLGDPRDTTSCDTSGEIFELLGALPAQSFDAIVAGHTHSQIGHFVNGMPVVESGSYGLQFGVIELAVSPRTRRPIAERTRIRAGLPICERVIAQTGDCVAKRWKPGMELVEATFEGVKIEAKSELTALLAPYLELVWEKQIENLSVSIPVTLTREHRAESALGNALADALRAMEGADVALLNSGGFRADLREGPLSYGGLYEVLPFDNAIAMLTVTGQEIVDLLETLLSGSHGVPQTSGLRFGVEVCGKHARITEITSSDGRPLDRGATYRLATSDFLALGGDGLGPVLARIPAARKDLGLERDANMRDALAAWFKGRGGTLEARVDGRMRITQAAAGCER